MKTFLLLFLLSLFCGCGPGTNQEEADLASYKMLEIYERHCFDQNAWNYNAYKTSLRVQFSREVYKTIERTK